MLTCDAPVFSARDLDEALSLRATFPDATVLAGGTDLMVGLELGAVSPSRVLNLWGVRELRGISGDATTGMRIGALTTFADLARATGVPDAVAEMARTIGAAQIQARATVGGNLVNASPAGDSLPVWLALDAALELASVRGTRVVRAEAFFLGYRAVDLAPDELLTAIEVPAWSDGELADRLTYRKVGTRMAQSISKVVFSGRLRVRGGTVTQARLALGSVAPTPIRLHGVEAALVGRPIDPDVAEQVPLEIKPITDVRSTAAYRSRVAHNIIRAWLHSERVAAGG